MSSRLSLGAVTVVAVLLLVPGCSTSERGYISVTNNADGLVSVVVGTAWTVDAEPNGGAALPTNGCSEGPVLVNYQDGRSVRLEGDLCVGQTLVVSETGVRVAEEDPSG